MTRTLDVQSIVDRIYNDCHEAHRGAFWWDRPRRIAVAFGNDGYATDARSQREVAELRKMLAGGRSREIGFATAAEGYSWALACDLADSGLRPSTLDLCLWMSWYDDDPLAPEHAAFTKLQKHIAEMALERNGLL
jgi:hypothetical protein